MSFYQKFTEIGSKFVKKHILFKYGFNLSPMYRRSTGKIIYSSEDLMTIKIKLPLTYKNKNYVSSIFGGSMFSAVDPIPMVQLINLLGNDYVVWDKSAKILFKRPAKEDLYANFVFSLEELNQIRQQIEKHQEIDILKITELTNKDKNVVYCEVEKTIYIANKDYFKKKKAKQKLKRKK